MRVRFVADTNFYVSAAISPHGNSMALIQAAQRGEASLCMNSTLHAELSEVLEREKFRKWFSLEQASNFIDAVTLLAEWAPDRPADEIPLVCEDPDDNYLVALCQDAGTGLLVSGDRAVRRIKYPNIYVYTPAEALELLDYRHEWGEGYLPGDAEWSQRQIEAEGSTAILTAYSAFSAVFEHATDREHAEYLLQFVAVPSAVRPFVEQFDTVRENLSNRGLTTRPLYASPEVAYVKLPPDPGQHVFSVADVPLPPDTIFATMQRCPDLPDLPDLPVDHWRVFGIGGQWPLEQIPPRPSA